MPINPEARREDDPMETDKWLNPDSVSEGQEEADSLDLVVLAERITELRNQLPDILQEVKTGKEKNETLTEADASKLLSAKIGEILRINSMGQIEHALEIERIISDGFSMEGLISDPKKQEELMGKIKAELGVPIEKGK